MHQIEIQEEALPILQQGLALQKRLNELKIEDYSERLQRFEEKYQMKSVEFARKFETGELGDDPHWFDWLFAYEAWKKAGQKKKIIESLSL